MNLHESLDLFILWKQVSLSWFTKELFQTVITQVHFMNVQLRDIALIILVLWGELQNDLVDLIEWDESPIAQIQGKWFAASWTGNRSSLMFKSSTSTLHWKILSATRPLTNTPANGFSFLSWCSWFGCSLSFWGFTCFTAFLLSQLLSNSCL